MAHEVMLRTTPSTHALLIMYRTVVKLGTVWT
jgi:hypothetical protein